MAGIEVSLDPGVDKTYLTKALLSLAQANNYMALKLIKELGKEKENIFFSPFSLSVSFAMLFSGARGKSALEMRDFLGYNIAAISDGEIHEFFKVMLTFFSEVNDSCILSIANAVLSQVDFPFLPEYKELVEINYGALLKSVDFLKSGKQVVLEINEWVKESTKEKITSLFDYLDPNTVMVLLNAVYFKGTWLYQFDPKNTRPELFYNRGLDSEVKEVPMMYIKKQFPFEERETFKILVLPYQGENMSMLLLLPKSRDGIGSLEEFVSSCSVNSLFDNLKGMKVKVTIPKLQFEYTKNLKSPLEILGMKSLFSDKANLQGLSNCDSLCVSEVVHKAVIEINEEGSEAAAVTGIVIARRCCMQPEPEFKADHPFIFLIADKNKMILFIGRVFEL